MSDPSSTPSATPTTHELSVPPDKAGTRLDLFVGDALGLSRARLKRLFDEGAIRVDGRSAKKGQLVAAGQAVRVTVEEQRRDAVADATSFELRVLHEDAQLVFVDKPAGRPSHPLQPGETGTVANALIARYPECAQASADVREEAVPPPGRGDQRGAARGAHARGVGGDAPGLQRPGRGQALPRRW